MGFGSPPNTGQHCPDFMSEDSYLARTGQVEEIWRSLCEDISPALLARLAECVFVMLKPDALATGKHQTMLDRMASAGWRILYAQAALTASARHFEELYKYNLTVRNEQNMLGDWWINARLYGMSPSLVLLLQVPPGIGRTAHQEVKSRKGPSNPFAGAPGQLRWEAGATNLALNLLHTADDPISSAREFLIFGSTQDLGHALARATAPDRAPARRAIPPEVSTESLDEQIFLAGTGDRRLDLPSVLIGIKSRLRATETSDQFVEATDCLYARYRDLARGGGDLHSRWRRFCDLSAEELALVDSFHRSSAPAQSDPIMRHLATPGEFRYETAGEIKIALLRRGIALDPWDDLALDTSMFYISCFQPE
ncbi:nucleoside-diphosphate kinase [Actinomadura sp. 6N118]|uniref:nucleoside-diphosphate kinase n=1 Tax=Actinomadura sp. 6N118 TaxID=3375151 RepID=UPI00378A0911